MSDKDRRGVIILVLALICGSACVGSSAGPLDAHGSATLDGLGPADGGQGAPDGGGSAAPDALVAWDAGVQGDGGAGADRSPPATSPDPSPPVVLTLPPSPDPARPFQHAAEVSIAARDGHVVAAAINIHTDGPDTLAAAALLRGVRIAVSHDFGATFEATVDPGLVAIGAAETSDPVVRVTATGAFWLGAVLISAAGNAGALLRSTTDGRTWEVVHRELTVYDKEWLAGTLDGGLVMAASGGLWRFDAAGAVVTSYLRDPDWPVMGAYADARGAHFVLERAVVSWTGGTNWEFEGSLAATGDPGWSVPIGPAGEDGTWAVFDRRKTTTEISVELRIFTPGDTVGMAIPVSAPGVPGFMPAAVLDREGRLHVIWYESGGARGVLKYARSLSRDLLMGFSPPVILDADACPGGGWIPEYTQSAPDRRLREYIDIAVDGRRVHAAWTHAPALPSRIYTSHWDF